MNNSNNKTDVIIVGAGLAGLTTARKLKKAGYGVKVIEARDRVGYSFFIRQDEQKPF